MKEHLFEMLYLDDTMSVSIVLGLVEKRASIYVDFGMFPWHKFNWVVWNGGTINGR